MAQLTRPIVFLTDFGARDHYVGQVKSVIATIAPGAPVIDLTHEIEPFAIDEAAWTLEVSLPFLPADAVVLAVVDPGVGTARRELVARADDRFFVGPDNGIFSALFPEDLRRAATPDTPPKVRLPGVELRELCEPQLRRPTVSATFHGRDIFGPAAAHLASGVDWHRVGPPRDEVLLLPPFCATPGRPGELHGYVVHVDRYGNLITTIRGSQLFPAFTIEVAGRVVARQVRTFADAPAGEPFCHVDSSGFIAIAINQGNAARELGASRRSPVVVRAR